MDRLYTTTSHKFQIAPDQVTAAPRRDRTDVPHRRGAALGSPSASALWIGKFDSRLEAETSTKQVAAIAAVPGGLLIESGDSPQAKAILKQRVPSQVKYRSSGISRIEQTMCPVENKLASPGGTPSSHPLFLPRLVGLVGALLSARILIVDDHLAARTAMRSLLDCHGLQVCGEASNGKEAIEKVIELKPDIVVLDINMPVMNGTQAASEIRRIAPEAKILFCTIHEGPDLIARLHLFAHGFVSKSAAGTELIPMINRLAEMTDKRPKKTT